MFKRKKESPQHELLQQLGIGSYFEIPEDFDCDAWLTATDRHIFKTKFRQKAFYFIVNVFIIIKSKLFSFGMKDINEDHSSEEFDDTEFIQTLERGVEIVAGIEAQVERFAELLLDTDRAEIEYRNKRIVYYRKITQLFQVTRVMLKISMAQIDLNTAGSAKVELEKRWLIQFCITWAMNVHKLRWVLYKLVNRYMFRYETFRVFH